MRLDGVASIIITMLSTSMVFFIHPAKAAKGTQNPDIRITVPKPIVDCHCEIIKRTVNVTPKECMDYCIWTFGWL